MQRVSTCLWFDHQAHDAATFYVGLFPRSRIIEVSHYLDGAPRPAGSVLTVRFTLDGTEHLALNGGPHFSFSPAISLVARCDTQDEVDTLWQRLGKGGQEGQSSCVTDHSGVSWQVVPRQLIEMIGAPDRAAAQRSFAAMMTMRKLDIAALQRAFADA